MNQLDNYYFFIFVKVSHETHDLFSLLMSESLCIALICIYVTDKLFISKFFKQNINIFYKFKLNFSMTTDKLVLTMNINKYLFFITKY